MQKQEASEKADWLFDGSKPAEYHKWRRWAQARLLKDGTAVAGQQPKLPRVVWGVTLFGWIRGTALELIDDISLDDLYVENGHRLIFDVLDARYPEKNKKDKLKETLKKTLKVAYATTDEGAEGYVGRIRSEFDRADAKDIKLPEEGKGFLLLEGYNLDDEQTAIVMASANQSYKFLDISDALISSYPKGPPRGAPRRSTNIHVAEPDEDPLPLEALAATAKAVIADPEIAEILSATPSPPEFEICRVLTEDPTFGLPEEGDLEEEVVIEALAAWNRAREVVKQAHLSRGFTGQKTAIPSRPAGLDRVKSRIRCFRCKQVGHMKKDCKASASQVLEGRRKALAFVQSRGQKPPGTFFVGMTTMSSGDIPPLDDEVQSLLSGAPGSEDDLAVPCLLPDIPVLLTQVIGQGIVDSGCGRIVVGEDTLRQHEELLQDRGLSVRREGSQASFTFGNDSRTQSVCKATVPVGIAGRHGTLSTHVIPGTAPFLISKGVLKALRPNWDIGEKSSVLRSRALDMDIPLTEGSGTGHYLLDLMDFPDTEPTSASIPVVQTEEITIYAVIEEDRWTDQDALPEHAKLEISAKGLVVLKVREHSSRRIPFSPQGSFPPGTGIATDRLTVYQKAGNPNAMSFETEWDDLSDPASSPTFGLVLHSHGCPLAWPSNQMD